MLLRLKRAHTGDTVGVEDAFGYVLVAVVVVSAVIAVLSLRGERYEHIGRGGLFEDDPRRRPSGGGGGGGAMPETKAQIDAEVREMLEQRNARRLARGQDPLDVEAEMRRLAGRAGPNADPALEAEVRQLVEARNARLARRGKPPLDGEAEVRRQLDDLMG